MSAGTVLVTGISGNAGRAIGQALAEAGFDVVGVVHRIIPRGFAFRPLMGDLDTPDAIATEAAMADAIVHCASPRSNDREIVLREIAAMGRLQDAWQGGPFAYLSSQVVYGVPRGILTEDLPTRADRWYDLGKLVNETQLAMCAAAAPKLKIGMSLRLPLLFGAGPRRRDRQFLPIIADSLAAGKTFRFTDEQLVERAGSVFVGERDLGAALVAAIARGRTGPYNLQSGFCTWKALIEGLAVRLGKQAKIRAGRSAGPESGEHWMFQSRSEYDCSKFETDTGFRPTQSLDELLDRFAAAERAG